MKMFFILQVRNRQEVMSEALLKMYLGTLFEAGADTTTSTLISLFLACTQDPGLCKKIQAEVDSFNTSARMPTMEDAREMKYVEAVALELLVSLPSFSTESGNLY